MTDTVHSVYATIHLRQSCEFLSATKSEVYMANLEETEAADDSGSDTSDFNIVNVSFEFFEIIDEDESTICTYLRQLMGCLLTTDEYQSLAAEIVAHTDESPCIGSTVKVDGEENDPLAFLSILPSELNTEKASGAVSRKLLEKLKAKSQSLIDSQTGKFGLLFSERIINMPAEVVPPMYSMLWEELNKISQENKSYDLDQFLLISKYINTPSATDDAKAKKKLKRRKTTETIYLHPEDEIFIKYSKDTFSFPFSQETTDEDLASTIIIRLEKEQLQQAIEELSATKKP